MSGSNGSVVIAIKVKAKYRYHITTILLFTLFSFLSLYFSNTYNRINFIALYQELLTSLLCHKSVVITYCRELKSKRLELLLTA
jgi:hypothetical protein